MKKLKMILVITILGLSIIPFGNSNANTVTGCSYKFVMAPYRPLTQCLKPVGPRFSGGYLVYGGFEVLFTDSEYKCYYFEASGEIMLHGCTLCRKTYISVISGYKREPVHDVLKCRMSDFTHRLS